MVRLIRALRAGGGRLLRSPRMTGSGLFIATAGHLGLSAVFALNLYAVSGATLPWSQLSWTIPAITTISCLPFTVAGAGVREMAAITLLGLYAVPSAECVVASMLTMIHKVMWAGVGAGVLWREQSVQETAMNLAHLTAVTVVIPAEEGNRSLATIHDLKSLSGVREVIVAPDVGVPKSPRPAATAKEAGVLVWWAGGTVLRDETLRRILEALRDGSIVAGSTENGRVGGFLGTMEPGWILRQFRQRSFGRDVVWFVRSEVWAALSLESSKGAVHPADLTKLLRRHGRLVAL